MFLLISVISITEPLFCVKLVCESWGCGLVVGSAGFDLNLLINADGDNVYIPFFPFKSLKY